MRVLGNRLLVEPVETPVSSTILIPDRSVPKPSRVRIVGVGSKVEDSELQVGVEVDITDAVGLVRVPNSNRMIISVRDVLAFVQ